MSMFMSAARCSHELVTCVCDIADLSAAVIGDDDDDDGCVSRSVWVR